MKTTNGNHFGFEGMQLTEPAQYTDILKVDFMIGTWIMMLIVNTNPQLEKYL
jgi:hypothetical protein